jgi:hypothetical protein
MGGLYEELRFLIGATRLLLKEVRCIIAEEEDCAFFRSYARSKQIPLPRPAILPPKPPEQTNDLVQAQGSSEGTQFVAMPTQSKTDSSGNFGISKPRLQKQEFAEQRALLNKIAPHIPILDEIPDDREARLLAERWKIAKSSSPILILYRKEHPAYTLFLQNIQSALTLTHADTSLIEVQDLERCHHWPLLLSSKGLKWILICESLLRQLPHLLALYREQPISSLRFLMNIPVFILPESAAVLHNPLLKRALWNQMKEIL